MLLSFMIEGYMFDSVFEQEREGEEGSTCSVGMGVATRGPFPFPTVPVIPKPCIILPLLYTYI